MRPVHPQLLKSTIASRRQRSAVTVIEAIVSAGLMLVVMSLVVRMTFSVDRVWRDVGQHRVAMQELSNQLDRLTMLPSDQLASAMKSLEVSEVVKRTLPAANLQSELIRDELGVRIVLRIDWQRPVPAKPLMMAAWSRQQARPTGSDQAPDTKTSEPDTAAGEEPAESQP